MSDKNGKQSDQRNSKGQFVAGNSFGQGRPKKERCITELLQSKGDEVQEDGRTRLQIIADKLYEKAQGGDLKAMEMIFDRIEGRPVQATITQFEGLPDGFITKRV